MDVDDNATEKEDALAEARLAFQILKNFEADGGFSEDAETSGTTNAPSPDESHERSRPKRSKPEKESNSPLEKVKGSRNLDEEPEAEVGPCTSSSNRCRFCLSIAICGIVILVVYAIFAYIIFLGEKAEGKKS